MKEKTRTDVLDVLLPTIVARDAPTPHRALFPDRHFAYSSTPA
jgi:hypothetical protein